MRSVPETDERTRRIWREIAPRYDRAMQRYDRLMLRDGRQWACGHAHGRVLEVAVGTGLNLAHYPPGTHVTGVDLSRAMLRRAARRAARHPGGADLVEAGATELPFGDGTFDTAVCALGLCCIPDDRTALAEMHRVLRPGGTLVLLDHVVSNRLPVRLLQRAVDPVLVRCAGDHQLRRPLTLLPQAGFAVTRRDRYRLGMIERLTATRL